MQPAPGARIQFRASLLPLLQALLTGFSTGLAVLLVILWRPERSRVIPFYSDATHNEPERVILALGENLACFLMPLVALAEHLQQARLATLFPRAALPRCLLCALPAPLAASRVLARMNLIVTLSTTLFFFITANVPSKFPYTKPHQFAASGLIFCYALQASLKAILARAFCNYDPAAVRAAEGDGEGFDWEGRKGGWWERHHMKVRACIAGALWMSLFFTWVCFVGRVTTREWGEAYDGFRDALSVGMAVIVHVATTSCLVLMAVMTVDLREEWVVVGGRGDM